MLVGIAATYFQIGYERDGLIWMLFLELAVYVAGLIAFLGTQTGRLKSGPESDKVPSTVLFEEDPSVRVYIAIYLVSLMLVVVSFAVLGSEIDIGPWNIFISACPIFLIVFFRQHRLERKRALSTDNVLS